MDTSVGFYAIKMFQKLIYASYILIFLTLPGKPELHRIFFNVSLYVKLYFRYYRSKAGRSTIASIFIPECRLISLIMIFIWFIKISCPKFMFLILVFMFTMTLVSKSYSILIYYSFFIIYRFFIIFTAF